MRKYCIINNIQHNFILFFSFFRFPLVLLIFPFFQCFISILNLTLNQYLYFHIVSYAYIYLDSMKNDLCLYFHIPLCFQSTAKGGCIKSFHSIQRAYYTSDDNSSCSMWHLNRTAAHRNATPSQSTQPTPPSSP